jgi:hypothetical protein
MNFHPNKQDSSKTDPVMTIYSPLDEYSTNIGTMDKNYTLPQSIYPKLSKAFDNVDTNALVNILTKENVPHHFINRIISACINELTCIKWLNQTTEMVPKKKASNKVVQYPLSCSTSS